MKYHKNKCKHIFIIFVMGKIYEDNLTRTGPHSYNRPEARGYVIYSPRALPEGAAREQHTTGIFTSRTANLNARGLCVNMQGG